MTETNLLASVALFRQLYDSETYKSIFDIIAEFITGAVAYEKKLTYSSEEIKTLLKKVYGFEILESVIRTTLKNKFNGKVQRKQNFYHFEKSILDKHQNIDSELLKINSYQEHILELLYSYISSIKGELSPEEKEKIFINLTHFLMDNGYSDEYSDLISAFIIKNSSDYTFKENINSIKEGLILYQGINFTADLNQLGKWENELVIYLSTEHLFNCLGYNGLIFQEIFNDFLNLVNEINIGNKQENKKRKKIELKYFEETKTEVDNFFLTAEAILKGYKKIDPSKLAMENILKGCNSISDIREKNTNFYIYLRKKGINLSTFNNYNLEISDYNVVDEGVVQTLKEKSKANNRYFDEDYCFRCLRIFTKINTLRKGHNNVPFDRIEHIYILQKIVLLNF